MKLFIVLLFLGKVYANSELLINTRNGPILGFYGHTENGHKIKQFIGIPYAQAPVGELRFEPPVPIQPWDGVLNATDIHPVCPQESYLGMRTEFAGEEDCLFLNIHTPSETNKKRSLSVMVYIHGGGYYIGSAIPAFHGPELLLDKDIILVTVNYRLGALGFLTTGDEVVPGNNGLKDQTLALKWIKENIMNFGGNPNSVTIFGNSAGGSSVHLHLVSEMSKDLFQAAISQSGTATAAWSYSSADKGVEKTKKLAVLLDCPTYSSKKMIDCLRTKSAKEIIQQFKYFITFAIDPMVVFNPVIEPEHEGAFLTDDPSELIKSGQVNDVPWMQGVTSEEGMLRSGETYGHSKHLLDELENNFSKYLSAMVLIDNLDASAATVKKEYFGNEHIANSESKYIDLITDALFAYPATHATNLHQTFLKQPLYYYLFSYKSSMTYGEQFGSKYEGTSHCDELIYLFKFFLRGDRTPTKTDLEMQEIMVTLWTNFAKFQNPTPENWDHPKWEPVKSENNEFYSITSPDDIKMSSNMFSKRMMFWKHLFSKKHEHEL